MTSASVRDPIAVPVLTPENAAFLFIDYEPAPLAGVAWTSTPSTG